ncbi:MAG: hypothetical protein FWG50_02785 [Kiritimatiellaeota bacterium]|nr:hypothetical protein [Kiritimatiellota bacterium]
MDDGGGVLVYDLADNRAVALVQRETPERQALLIQRGAGGETFFTFDEHGKHFRRYSRQRDGKSYISERDTNRVVIAKWETAIPPPTDPMKMMALSPDGEKAAFLIRSERPAPYLCEFNSEKIEEARITTKAGTLLKVLEERPNNASSGIMKSIHWLSDETVITSSHHWKDRSDQVVIYDLKADAEKTMGYPFGRTGTTSHILPSPDNRHVLLLRGSKNHVDILDPWAMALVGEVQVPETVRQFASIGTAWLDNDEFIAWDAYSSRIIRHSITTGQTTLIEPRFPASKYSISTFVNNHFILRKDGSCGKWSYNVKTGKLHRITKYAVGCICPLNDNIILLDWARP